MHKAKEFATNKSKLDSVREKIINSRNCRLFDSLMYTKDLEEIYKSLVKGLKE